MNSTNITLDVLMTDLHHERPTVWQVWGLGLLSVTLISSCAVVGIGIMPLVSKRMYHRALTYLVGLGVGSLSGSAVFHLLPQAFGIADDPEHKYLNTSLFVIAGIYMFFFTDKLLKVIMEFRKDHGKTNRYVIDDVDVLKDNEVMTSNGHGHSHNHQIDASGDANCLVSPTSLDVNDDNADVQLNTKKCRVSFAAGEADKRSLTHAEHEKQAHGLCSHDHDVKFNTGDSVIATVAWMIIFGDGLHNLVDGLSIGAAFTESPIVGISVSVAVLAEEFPHELGDVAILVSAGMTVRQALTYNLLSALTCYIGFVIGVLIGELRDLTPYIFAVAGGMFLYISLASMIPEMNEAMTRQLSLSRSRGLRVLLLQSAGLITGMALMYLFARYGSNITIG